VSGDVDEVDGAGTDDGRHGPALSDLLDCEPVATVALS
jgi:hypothetical protein